MSEEHKCPECGGYLQRGEDPLGVTYQCFAADCLSTFTRDEIEEPLASGGPVKGPVPTIIHSGYDIPAAALARIERLRRIIHRYGDRHGMATCPRPDWQREIDDAMAWVADNPEGEVPDFPGERPA